MNPVPPRSSSLLATGEPASRLREMIEATDNLMILFTRQRAELTRLVQEARSVNTHPWVLHDLAEEIRELGVLQEIRRSQLRRRRGPPSFDDEEGLNEYLFSPFSRRRRLYPLDTPAIPPWEDVPDAANSGSREVRGSDHLPSTPEMANPSQGIDTPIHRESTAATRQNPTSFRRPEAASRALAERRSTAARQLLEAYDQGLDQLLRDREIYQQRNPTTRTSLAESDLDVLEFAWRADERLPSYTAAMRSPPPPYDWRDAVYGIYANTPVSPVPRNQHQAMRHWADIRQYPQTPRPQQEAMRISVVRGNRPVTRTHRPQQEVRTDGEDLDRRLRQLNNRLNPQARRRNEVTRETGSRASFSQQGGIGGSRNSDLLE